jgi:hypothetical protein
VRSLSAYTSRARLETSDSLCGVSEPCDASTHPTRPGLGVDNIAAVKAGDTASMVPNGNDLLDDRWFTIDRPVLLEIGRIHDRQLSGFAESVDIAATLGLDHDNVIKAIKRLERGGLIEGAYYGGGLADASAGPLSAAGMQATGVWPSAEAMWQRLLNYLDGQAASAPSTDERGRWERLLEGARAAGVQVGVNVMSALASGYIPHAH